MKTLKWYKFSQNNSGGKVKGPLQVWVEAYDRDDANYFAEKEGTIYFDGVANGNDCSCCGDRWHRVESKYDEFSSLPTNLHEGIENQYQVLVIYNSPPRTVKMKYETTPRQYDSSPEKFD